MQCGREGSRHAFALPLLASNKHPLHQPHPPEMRAYTYFSLWKPYWCSRVGLRLLRITPCFSSSWLATSAAECRPSASSALSRSKRGGSRQGGINVGQEQWQ